MYGPGLHSLIKMTNITRCNNVLILKTARAHTHSQRDHRETRRVCIKMLTGRKSKNRIGVGIVI